MIITIVLVCVFVALGASTEDEAGAGALLGAMVGLLGGGYLKQSKRLKQLGIELTNTQDRLGRLENRGPALASAGPQTAPPARSDTTKAPSPNLVVNESGLDDKAQSQTQESATQNIGASEPSQSAPANLVADDRSAAKVQVSDTDTTTRPPATAQEKSSKPAEPQGPNAIDQGLAALKELFFGGNTLVRVGILVLLVGVGLLGKYAADNDMFPPAARILMGALISLTLIGVGWRLRTKRRSFALSLQGGGIGSLFITIFIALKLYALIPAPAAFLLLVLTAAFASAIAVLEDSLALAFLATLGGFLAPIMASTGSGNHLVLFSYYTVLNVAILGIAWFKAWRALNVLGFIATLGISASWAASRYTPEHFSTTEPFLIIFFVLYVIIPVLFARRMPTKLKGFVDGTLVFGTPVAVFTLQAKMVDNYEFGLAYSAVGMAATYILTATVLLKRSPETMRKMVEAFVPIGIAFLTLAIPLAIDNAFVVAAMWALEGAGLHWFGCRQDRALARWSGYLLQIGSGVAFGIETDKTSIKDAMSFVNGRFVAAWLIGLSAMALAYVSNRYREKLWRYEGAAAQVYVYWGGAWLLFSTFAELDRLLPKQVMPAVTLAVMLLFTVTYEFIGKTLRWNALRFSGLWWVLPATLLVAVFGDKAGHPGGNWGWLVWPVTLLGFAAVVKRQRAELHPLLLKTLILWQWTMVSILLSWDGAWHTMKWSGENPNWVFFTAILVLGLSLMLPGLLARRVAWPFAEHRRVFHLGYGLPTMGALSLMAFIMLIEGSGDGYPIGYLPLINPADIAQALTLVFCLDWYSRGVGNVDKPISSAARQLFWWCFGGATLLALNGILARAVHHYASVRYNFDSLWDSVAYQTSSSIFWATLALIVMVIATRGAVRVLWFVSATVLGFVVIKLFLVDLSSLGTGARIVSFLVVGGLMLLIGYFSPLPPSRDDVEKKKERQQTPTSSEETS